MGCQDWPIHGTGRSLIHAVVVHVSNNADNLAPVVFRVGADLFAESKRWIVPGFSRQLFRDNGQRNLAVDIAPGEVATGNQWRAQGLEEARGDEPEAVNRKLIRRVFPVLYEDGIFPSVTVHGDAHGEANG